MTAVEFDRVTRGAEPYQAHGWVASMVCHLLAVGCAMVLMGEIEKPPLPTLFHWEVATVEATAQPEPSPVAPSPAPPEPRPAKRMIERQPPVNPVAAAKHVVRETAPAVEAFQPMVQTTDAVVPAVEAVLERPAAQSIETDAVVARTIATTGQEAVVEQVASQTAAASTVERGETIAARSPIEAAPQVSRPDAVSYDSSPVESASSAIEHRVVEQRRVQHRQIRADYGWLRDTLWSRISELKRYPLQAKMNHWEGKVVVEAVIRADGTVIGLKVAESSGRDILDQDAMTVMRKASPLALRYPLGQPQVTILVPISYRLDG